MSIIKKFTGKKKKENFISRQETDKRKEQPKEEADKMADEIQGNAEQKISESSLKAYDDQRETEQEEITQSLRRLQVLIHESSDVFEIIDPDGTIKYISESVENVIGFKPEERLGKKIYDFYVSTEAQKLAGMVKDVLNKPDSTIRRDVILQGKNGRIYLEVNMRNLLHEPAIEGIAINFRDVTKRVAVEKRMAYISYHDELTGLPNSMCFRNQLRIQFQYAKATQAEFAVMMLCLGGLKYINHSLGYDLGYQLIFNVAMRLKTFLKKDMFLSRYSEDHFAIIVQNPDDGYENIAKELISLLTAPYRVKSYEIDVTINIGIYVYSGDAPDTDSLIKQSLSTLLRARKEGKNRYKFYSSDLDIQNYKEIILRNDLRKAVDEGQLKIYYQPIVNLSTNKILAAEALIRWEHPEWGIISPHEFVAIAEETSQIIKIGNWMLREVCRNYKQWLNNRLPKIKVSVNFSSVQFFEKNFAENIKNTIDEFELDPHFLIMEITESILMDKYDKTVSDIKRLQSYGIQTALDDFGQGYSSLSYLNTFDIDILKIDGSFIKNVVKDETSTIITMYIIKMAQELKIKLVAEKIENWEQLSFLRDLDCYAGQGYIFSRPVALEVFEKVLARRKLRPVVINDTAGTRIPDRRKYFRIKFYQLLEADMTILEIKGKKLSVGNTKVLIKNIGPGGLCFISNIRFPVGRDFVLQFSTQLLGKELKVHGCTVWTEELDETLFEYGIEFTIDENDRTNLIKELNQTQIKMKNNILFADGNFVSCSAEVYFKKLN